MYKLHQPFDDGRYIVLAPIEWLGKAKPHMTEAKLLGKTFKEFYEYIATFKSARLTTYPNYISYSMEERDAKKLLSQLNKLYKATK